MDDKTLVKSQIFQPPTRWNLRTVLEWAVLGVGSAYILLFLVLSIVRLVYPYEVEWNEGAVLDHAIRILNGQPVYSVPTLDFAAFVYTPLYYYAVALLMKIGGIGLWSGRLISVVSTILSAFIFAKITYREIRRDRVLTFASGALYFAWFRTGGYFYDIVRMDAFAVFLISVAIYAALYWRRGTLWAAIFVALAYFTKQQSLIFLPAIAIPLFMTSRRKGMTFLVISLSVLLIGYLFFQISTHGWFHYYTILIPSTKAAHYFSWLRAIEFVPTVLLGTFAIATLLIVAAFVPSGEAGNHPIAAQNNYRLLIFCWCAAVVSAAIGMGNEGGYKNVFMPMIALSSILLPISLYRMQQFWPNSSHSLSHAVLLFLFLSLLYNPFGESMLIASTRQRQAGDEFVRTLQQMPGEIFIPFHGYLNGLAGKQTHVHFMALQDVINVGDTTSRRLARELDSAYARHRFNAIILDENKAWPIDSIRSYYRTGQIFSRPNVFLSRLGDGATRPQTIFSPSP